MGRKSKYKGILISFTNGFFQRKYAIVVGETNQAKALRYLKLQRIGKRTKDIIIYRIKDIPEFIKW